jgi:hypothetical protein
VFGLDYTYCILFSLFYRKREHSQMTSFLRKFIVGQTERKERSIIFDFNVYVDVVYLGSSRALFSHNSGHIPFSLPLSLSRSFTLAYCSVFVLLPPLGQSVMRKEKE